MLSIWKIPLIDPSNETNLIFSLFSLVANANYLWLTMHNCVLLSNHMYSKHHRIPPWRKQLLFFGYSLVSNAIISLHLSNLSIVHNFVVLSKHFNTPSCRTILFTFYKTYLFHFLFQFSILSFGWCGRLCFIWVRVVVQTAFIQCLIFTDHTPLEVRLFFWIEGEKKMKYLYFCIIKCS